MKQQTALEQKRPGASVVLRADWTDYLASIGDPSVVSSVWTATPSCLTFDDDGITAGVARATVSGGADGTTYLVENWITVVGTAVDPTEPFVITLVVGDGL